MTDLNTLIENAAEKWRREQRDAKALRAAQEAAEQQKATIAFTVNLYAEFPLNGRGDILSELDVTYDAGSADAHGDYLVVGRFKFENVEYSISASRLNHPDFWRLSASASQMNPIIMTCKQGALFDTLLLAFAAMREEYAKNEAKRVERERLNAEREAENERRRKLEDAQETELRRQQDAEDAAIRVDVELTIDAARAALWQWKPGAVLVYYKLTYTTGVGVDRDGEIVVDSDSAYTLSDAHGGYLTVHPTWNPSATRQIKLDLNAHKPVFERLSAASIEDLPDALLEDAFIDIPGVKRVWISDDEYRWQYAAQHVERVRLTRLPFAWLRERIDSL